MAWHMTLVLGALMVLIIAQSHPSLAVSYRRTLEKQQLHHVGRAVGSDHLPLAIPLTVGESKRGRNMRPPAPVPIPVSSHLRWRPSNPRRPQLSAVTPPPPPPQALPDRINYDVVIAGILMRYLPFDFLVYYDLIQFAATNSCCHIWFVGLVMVF